MKSLSAQLPSSRGTPSIKQSALGFISASLKSYHVELLSARDLCHGVDKGDDEDQLVGSTVTEIGGKGAFELVEKDSEELSGMETARFGFPDFVKETVGEKIVGAKGETIVLGRLFDHDPSYRLARRFKLL